MGALTKVGGAGLLLVVAAGVIWFGDEQPVDVTPRGPDDEVRVVYTVSWEPGTTPMSLVEYGISGASKRQTNRTGGRWSVADNVERGTYVELRVRFNAPAGKTPKCSMYWDNGYRAPDEDNANRYGCNIGAIID